MEMCPRFVRNLCGLICIKSADFFDYSLENICIYQKKVVILQPQLRINDTKLI